MKARYLNFCSRLWQSFSVFILSLVFVCSQTLSHAQSVSATESDIYKALKKLNVLGSVLYIAAHPDDENTSVLTYMAQGKLLRTAYLSLTRGDGGQNLLGDETGALLGVIRTQELLSARRIDGAEQFFTRAIDFGYSKTATETLQKWDRQQVLSDMVRVIRRFRPDIILTRFSETRGGHGHHIASAILAKEAFYTAADPNQFPEQLQEMDAWQATRLMWNTWAPSKRACSIDVGTYDPAIGTSYQELAATGRSMHKSQGFGVSPSRGSQLVYFDLTAGDSADSDLFESVDLTWNRLPDTQDIQNIISMIIDKFDPDQPFKSIPDLVSLHRQLKNHQPGFWIQIKIKEVEELIRMCSGLWLESIVWQAGISPGLLVDVRSMVIIRSPIPVDFLKISTTYASRDSSVDQKLEFNKPLSIKQTVLIPGDAPYTQPFWLEKPNDGYMFTLSYPGQIDHAETPPAIETTFYFKIAGEEIRYTVPVVYRWTGAVKGEQIKPFIIRPLLNISIDQPVHVFTNTKSREINVCVQTNEKNAQGKLTIDLPKGWLAEPAGFDFKLIEQGDQKEFSFKVRPVDSAQSGEAVIKALVDSKEFTDQIVEIDYNHIKAQTILLPTNIKLVRLDIQIIPARIGYIMGSGDEIPQSLTQLGYQVDLLSDDELNNSDLSAYDAIICGVRAFNVRKQLEHQQKRLIKYVQQGGTWIVQHNTRFGFHVEQIGPYPFTASGRDRISEEDAPIEILIPDHPVFNYPNEITERDFDGWVQERGTYLAENWGGKLFPLLSGHDKGEPSKLGGILYANYGKGVFIYTALSWFRQLPAGVPGAHRLFANLIAAKGKQ